jgi:hypothetical protein
MRYLTRLVLLALVLVLPALSAGGEEDDARAAALTRIRALHAKLELAPRDSYLNYAISTIARREGINLKKEKITFPLVPVVTGDPAHRTDLFGVVTGAHAIQESLQLTALFQPDGWGKDRLVPLAELSPPTVDVHIPEAPKDAPVDAEARLVPRDWIYLRFADGPALTTFCRQMRLWADHILTVYARDARAPLDLGKAFERLGLPDPRSGAALYEKIGVPFAVVMSDPFLREGTALAVLFPKGSPTGFLVKGVLGNHRSKDGRVTRFVGEVGDHVAMATSRKAIEVLKGVAKDPSRSLAEMSEYRLMRSKLPPVAGEASFLFLSDHFVRRMVGPRLKILESRRLRCAANLHTITNAALLHHEEKGALPKTLADLDAGDYLVESVRTCPHTGGYALANGLEATCTMHGRLGAMRPHLDFELETVTAAEARAYRRYARAYEALWRQYYDPVGVRFVPDGSGWTAETVVLPLASSSLYRNMHRVAGGAPVAGSGPIAPTTVFHFSMKLDRRFVKAMKDDPFQLEKRFGANLHDAMVEGFGDHVTLGLLDDRLLFDFDIASFLGHAIRWDITSNVMMAPLLASANLPAYATISIKDRARVERFLDNLHAGAAREAARPRGGRFSLRVGCYDRESPVGPPIRVLTVGFGDFKVRLYHAFGDGVLVLATRPEVVESVFWKGKVDPDRTPHNLKLTLTPDQWRKLMPDMLVGYEEAARTACSRRLAELAAFESVGIERLAKALGRETHCPDGGALAIGFEGGPTCTIHGTAAHPRQPREPPAANPTARLLKATGRITISLTFEDDGLRTIIRVAGSD